MAEKHSYTHAHLEPANYVVRAIVKTMDLEPPWTTEEATKVATMRETVAALWPLFGKILLQIL